MKTIEIILLNGSPAALVAGDRAIIPEHLSGADRARVQAKALYAIQITAGTRLGPYTDTAAETYARSMAANGRLPAATRQPGPRRPGGRRRA